jgi:hypothetical protein
MKAIEQWFGRPESGTLEGLYTWLPRMPMNTSHLVEVTFLAGDTPQEPTIDIIDNGIGIEPTSFDTTILSLQQGNKLTKPYLSGTWGQGGAATLAFCNYILIVSRYMLHSEKVAFTLIKRMYLGENYKTDAYVYLATLQDMHMAGRTSVPSTLWNKKLSIYPSGTIPSLLKDNHTSGTLVRHYGYRLENIDKSLSSSPNSFAHTLQSLFFDPPLPFTLSDRQKPNTQKDLIIEGSRNRLMKGIDKRAKDIPCHAQNETLEENIEVRYHAPRIFLSPCKDIGPVIGAEYWVVLQHKPSGIRSSASELFVNRNMPIIFTCYGQNHGEMSGRLLRDLKLPLVSKQIVIHLDASYAPQYIRNQLFTSTRETLKESEILTTLQNVLIEVIRDDPNLYIIERELEKSFLTKEAVDSIQEVKQQLIQLLRDTNLHVIERSDKNAWIRQIQPRTKEIKSIIQEQQQLDSSIPSMTLPYPTVTKFFFSSPKQTFRLPYNEQHTVRIETNADVRFDYEKRIQLSCVPDRLEIASKERLHDGQLTWRLRAAPDAHIGDVGILMASLIKPDGNNLSDTLNYEILPKREFPLVQGKGLAPSIELISLHPEEDHEEFDAIWDFLTDEEERMKVAYRAIQHPDKISVYYSTAFPPYAIQYERFKAHPHLLSHFNHHYQLWIGYHAILQLEQRTLIDVDSDISEAQLERILDHERTRVALMQVQIAARQTDHYQATLQH